MPNQNLGELFTQAMDKIAPKTDPAFTNSISLGATTITEAQLIKLVELSNEITIQSAQGADV